MATQVVSGSIQFVPSFTEVISTGLLNSLSLPAGLNIQTNYLNATTGANTVDQIHGKVYSLTTSTPTTIDLTSLLDMNGNSMNFVRVRDFIVVNNDSNSTHTVQVSCGASNGWPFLPPVANALVLQPLGGVVWLHDPQQALSTNGMVTTNGKNITFTPGAYNVNISVLIVGGSAT